MTPTLTIVVPTCGRATLPTTLDSIARQALIRGDRVIVAYDSFESLAVMDIAALVSRYGFELVPVDAGYHFYGNPQLNHALTLVDTDFVCALGDDDVYVDGAIARLRTCLTPGRVVLFRFYSPPYMVSPTDPRRFVLWSDRRLRVANLSGCCIAAPREAIVPVSADRRIEVDFEWIRDIVAQTGRPPVWMKDCLIIARPDLRDGEPVHRGVGECGGCGLVAFLEDLDADRICDACAETVVREFCAVPA